MVAGTKIVPREMITMSDAVFASNDPDEIEAFVIGHLHDRGQAARALLHLGAIDEGRMLRLTEDLSRGAPHEVANETVREAAFVVATNSSALSPAAFEAMLRFAPRDQVLNYYSAEYRIPDRGVMRGLLRSGEREIFQAAAKCQMFQMARFLEDAFEQPDYEFLIRQFGAIGFDDDRLARELLKTGMTDTRLAEVSIVRAARTSPTLRRQLQIHLAEAERILGPKGSWNDWITSARIACDALEARDQRLRAASAMNVMMPP